MSDPVLELASRWREEAELFRSYGASLLATAFEKHAEDLESALGSWNLEGVTLEEAAKIGGYSYSHLQHLVADGKVENVGEKHCPRIRRRDVPCKPGRGRPGSRSKTELIDQVIPLHRGGDAD